jgi:hypothetical protein
MRLAVVALVAVVIRVAVVVVAVCHCVRVCVGGVTSCKTFEHLTRLIVILVKIVDIARARRSGHRPLEKRGRVHRGVHWVVSRVTRAVVPVWSTRSKKVSLKGNNVQSEMLKI